MTRRTVISRRGVLLGVVPIVLLGFAAHTVLPGLADPLAYLSPALLLLLVLAARRYPGERALMALMDGRRGPRRHGHDEDNAYPRRSRAVVPRGGLLIATSLAVRPPPAHRAVALI